MDVESHKKARFTERTSPLLTNPHKGCATFQRFNGDPLNEGTRWSEEGPLTFPEAPREVADQYLPSTVAYCRWFWVVFEPEEGRFDWSAVEQSLATARARGQTLQVRLMPHGSQGQPQHIEDSAASSAALRRLRRISKSAILLPVSLTRQPGEPHMKRDDLVTYLDDYLYVNQITDVSNNGLQVEGAGEVNSVAFAVDAGLAAFQGARVAGAQMLIVHHGLFWGRPVMIIGIHRRRLEALFDAGISL